MDRLHHGRGCSQIRRPSRFLGGTVLEPPNHARGVGTICVLEDSVGALIDVMKPEHAPAE
jgi:predicted enzyme related to lactoylglutathione lyase